MPHGGARASYPAAMSSRNGRIAAWTATSLVLLVVLGVLVAAGGSLLSLDWKHTHREQTRALAEFSGFDGSATAEMRLVRIAARGMQFRARIAGTQGDPVILLHGFPTTSAMWEPLMTATAEQGFRVLAFDQRGYSPDARPTDTAAYAVPELVDDVLAIADAAGFERFHLVGHDWGSAVGWGTVLRAPERVISWTALSIPHPAAFTAALADDPDQQSRSRYFALFRTPWVPEVLFTFGGLRVLRSSVYAPMSEAERDEYVDVFSEPGALTAALQWYRAVDRSSPQQPPDPKVAVPTLFLWGNRDDAVARSGVDKQREFMTGPFHEVELEAGHWLLEENARAVIPETLAHLTHNRGGRDPRLGGG
jgi:pimeloyl-ACP methyl ester carboxylesterase